MHTNSKWSLKKDVFLEIDADGKSGILIDTNSSNYCSCNKTALLILEKLKKGKTDISNLTKEILKTNNYMGNTKKRIITWIFRTWAQQYNMKL